MNYINKIKKNKSEINVMNDGLASTDLVSSSNYYSKNDLIYKNVLPPLSILNSKEEKELIDNLEKLDFSTKPTMAAWNAIS